ncbi:ribosomal protein S18-alanine N-acetyltransferase [Nocardioides sp. CER19]|uniref:ribosomal protein S18-alanine N-acetyltransferase n=1 Tax=Nocardioides sp. CER19 TaxID=3038538 RepID=UPI00244A7563|nr:ribosomal protein S18-alanine N-acetyltransferase [Nocardioides sp. CER19]MDH2413563.1 ribosomal protein S18-alanine N-acetyltransferase [Nocardioides sp. CER19]
MTVRPATTADVEEIAQLELESFPGDAWTADYLRIAAEGGMPTVLLLVAEHDGAIVGHAIVSIVYEIAELQRIAVGSAYRRQGHARALLDHAVATATDEGAERLLLEVRETNEPALAFYASAGFVEIDRRPRYYRDGTAGIILVLPLDQGR